MFPLRDSIPSFRPPVINVMVILSCVAVFVYQLTLGPALQQFIEARAFVPARLFFPGAFDTGVAFALGTTVFSMFLHGGWLHLIGNMWFLWVFGDNVEDALGHLRYLVFYLVCGVAAALTQGVMDPGSVVPMVGASGAVAGVLGAYFVWFPWAQVRSLVFLVFIFTVADIPAFFFLLLWFVFQFFSGTLALSAAGGSGGGVAWFAHVGGFAVGAALAAWLRLTRRVSLPARYTTIRGRW